MFHFAVLVVTISATVVIIAVMALSVEAAVPRRNPVVSARRPRGTDEKKGFDAAIRPHTWD